MNARNLEALAALYAVDARVLAPNTEMTRGREAIKASFGAMIDAGLSGDLEPVEIATSGDLGYSLGSYVLSGPEGEEIDRGKYIEIWRRIEGEWKIVADTWNSDLPPTPPSGR